MRRSCLPACLRESSPRFAIYRAKPETKSGQDGPARPPRSRCSANPFAMRLSQTAAAAVIIIIKEYHRFIVGVSFYKIETITLALESVASRRRRRRRVCFSKACRRCWLSLGCGRILLRRRANNRLGALAISQMERIIELGWPRQVREQLDNCSIVRRLQV